MISMNLAHGDVDPGPALRDPPEPRRGAGGKGRQACRPRLGLAGSALALALAGAAHGQETPLGFSIGPAVTEEHDSNFTRGAGAALGQPVVADSYTEADLIGSFYETYGRQIVNASASVGRVLFKKETLYDYTRQDLKANLESDFPYTIKTIVSAEHSAQLARFADIGSAVRDVIGRNDIEADLYFPLVVDWQGILLATLMRVDNSAPSFVDLNVDTKEIDAGTRYQPSSGNHVDLVLRDTLGSYPNGTASNLISPTYRERGVDLRLDWTFSGASHLLGRAGYLQRRNDDLYITGVIAQGPRRYPLVSTTDINRNFSGPSFELTYIWTLSKATNLTAYGVRQIGVAGDYNYLSAITNTYRITPGYTPDEKVGFNAYFEWTRRNYFNSYAALTDSQPGTTRLDTWRNAGLSMRWTPRRWLQVTFDVHRENRDSNIALYSYVDNVASVGIAATF
jgi:hypothetical protein